MNKIACDVIKDLLLMYVDDVCSEKSKDLIEEHLAGCEDCQKYYEALQENLPEITLSASANDSGINSSPELEFIKKVSKKIQKRTTVNRVAIGLVICIFLMFAVLSSGPRGYDSFYFIPFLDNRLEIADIRVTEIYELEDGDIYFTLESDEKISWPSLTSLAYDEYKGDDTEYYSSAELTYSWWSDHIENCGYVHSLSFIYPVETWAIDKDNQKRLCEISAIYYEGKNDERMTIWTDNQELEKAPENVEKKVAEGREDSEYENQGCVLFNFE